MKCEKETPLTISVITLILPCLCEFLALFYLTGYFMNATKVFSNNIHSKEPYELKFVPLIVLLIAGHFDICFPKIQTGFILYTIHILLWQRACILDICENKLKTRLITMRSKPDYVEFVLLQLLLMLLLWFLLLQLFIRGQLWLIKVYLILIKAITVVALASRPCLDLSLTLTLLLP